MKPIFSRRAAVLAPLLSLLFAACNSNDDGPAVEVTELPAGVYAVSAGDAAAPTEGKYYAASDGSRLLVLNNSVQQATAIYQRTGSGNWQATPAPSQDTRLELLRSNALQPAAVNAASFARNYVVRLASGAAAAFSVSASGDIVAGGTACKLSGKVTATSLPNALKLSLATAGCGDLPAQSEGYLVADGDYAPATFRLLTAGGATPVDLWAYPE